MPKSTKKDLVVTQDDLDREDLEIKKLFPDPGQLPGVLDPHVIGEIGPAKPEEQRLIVDDADGLRLMREYGYSIHPGTKRTRVISVLMALESEALKGSIQAAREFLDRAAGKVVDVVAIGHGRFSSMSDRDLVDIIVKKSVTKKK